MKKIYLSDGEFFLDKLPEYLIPDDKEFETLWNLHPNQFNKIEMYNKKVFIPRWQQAYGKNYFFSNQTSVALPIPEELSKYLGWVKKFNSLYNGLLLNWYDSDKKHYIGRHSDSTNGLIVGSHIFTISIGADRLFRIRKKGKSQPFEDILVSNGSVLIIPWKTNLTHTHEVPYLGKYEGRRISITARAFK